MRLYLHHRSLKVLLIKKGRGIRPVDTLATSLLQKRKGATSYLHHLEKDKLKESMIEF
jgi:hypothetical protein